MVVTRADTGETITVQNQFLSSGWGLEKIQFDDGTIWDRTYLTANSTFVGTSGAETINGTGGDDLMYGLAGNDTLQGSSGSDTYLHRSGSGNDIINDSGNASDTDTLRLIGVTASNASLSHSGSYDMVVIRADTGETITVQNQ